MYNNNTCDKALLGADIERRPRAWLHPRASFDGEETRVQFIGEEIILNTHTRIHTYTHTGLHAYHT
jgi:hypothetical protein